eukprot:snap_masked-scaffold_1-processed-gene-5.23-mRNA-1 protein AED:1.00 eAED:1.00 QI:0/-1/0/0/-1/1/1/0/264
MNTRQVRRFGPILCDYYQSQVNKKSEFGMIIVPKLEETLSFSSYFLKTEKDQTIAFFRSIFQFLKQEKNCRDYHFAIRPKSYADYAKNRKTRRSFGSMNPKELGIDLTWSIFLMAKTFESEQKREEDQPPDALKNVCDSDLVSFMDKSGRLIKKNVTYGELVVESDFNNSTRVVLDAQGRDVYVVVSTRKEVYTVFDLGDEEFYSCLKLIADISGENDDVFQEVKLNCGAFQNIRSLHFKVWMPSNIFRTQNSNNVAFQKLKKI